MDQTNLTVEVQNHTAWITINRPSKLNSITVDVLNRIRETLLQYHNDSTVWSMVITGSGERAFCSGVDLGPVDANNSIFDSKGAIKTLGDLFKDMWTYPKPIIAMVRGFALAGGFGLACACDIVICSSDAVFGAPEINVGLWPYVISVPLLRSIPARVLLDLMMTGRNIDASEALRLNLVNTVVEGDDLEATVREKLSVLHSKSTAALGLGKQSFYHSLDLSSEASLDYLANQLEQALSLEDFDEGRAAFAQRRDPVWRNR